VKTPGKFIYGIVTIAVLLFQLMSPTLVHADDETPPPPSDTPMVTSTSETLPTEVVPTESPTTESATDVAVTESPTADPTLITPVSTATVQSDVTPTDPASPTVDSVETNTPAETATLVSTDSVIETLPTESPTPDVSSSTPAPTDSSTPDTSSNTPISTATEPSILTPTDSASPTIDPAETSTPIPTQPETLEPPSDTPAGTSTSIPMESTTETTPLESPAQADPATDAIATEVPTLTEVLQEVPEDTEVVVLDENGQPLSLVTQEAIDIIANSDPMWCPDGVAPGGMGCTPSYATMDLLLTTEGSNINAQNVNGTIWITSGAVSDTNPIFIDGSSYTNWANFSLTLQGGWSGVSGDATIGSNSSFSVPITISNWLNNVTVNNITVDNTSGDGLTIDTGANATIANSTFSRNSGDGAFMFAQHSTISKSTFNGNGGNGALIDSLNATISNSTFNGNSGNGADLSSYDHVTITQSTFSGNSENGLNTFVGNNIAISDSTFSNNGSDGVSTISENVTINNNTFDGNGGNGATLEIGNATVSNNTFSNNVNVGLYLNDGGGSNFGFQGVATLICNHFQNNGQDEDLVVGTLVRTSCDENPKPLPQFVIIFPPGQDFVEFSLDCTRYSSFLVWLPNGDKVVISCVVSGSARISRLDNTTLPKDLPAGYEYASAFKVEIFQNGVSLPAITTSGSILASFVSRHEDPHYSIMVWDEKINDWKILNEYQIDPNGAPVMFPFDQSNLQDARRILSGVRLMTTYDPDREEVTSNFPGTFVLVQQQ
jgi:parallel beta helix pectate lyase-like protein